MIVSWKWLADYLDLSMPVDELCHRLAMSGLNHEGTSPVGDDFAIDLEVTSNRPDCLGHLGIAREIAVLWDLKLKLPDPVSPENDAQSVADSTSVEIQCPDLCPRYTARVIRGAKVKASPDWLADRLEAVGVNSVNNIVDATNYVMLECGQPLHAFDFSTLEGGRIVVRRGRKGEQLEAIDHRTYELNEDTCVIADASKAVAVGGVMGGAVTEVSAQTSDILIEAADFAPLSIRTTARRLKLHSPSSYRFERGIDAAQLDWASRRCCQIILETAGGQLDKGAIWSGDKPATGESVVLRFGQLARVLGIDVDADTARRILTALGCVEDAADATQVRVTPPSWRRDLTREIDLVEEVARIHGYDKIPEDVSVPMVASHRSDEERVVSAVRHVLLAAGFDEAMTVSMVADQAASVFSPWTEQPPLRCEGALIKGADVLRQSLTPSLLEARRHNEALSNDEIELFETARVFVPQKSGLPSEQRTLALTSGLGFLEVKGVLEQIVATLRPGARLEVALTDLPLLETGRSCRLEVDGHSIGFLGELSAAGREHFKLRQPATIAEVSLDVLRELARLLRTSQPLSPYPAIEQDMNFVVAETLRWSDLEATVTAAAGPLLERLSYRETYRDAKRDGAGNKRLLFTVNLRSSEGTLTGQQAEEVRANIQRAVQANHDGKLLG